MSDDRITTITTVNYQPYGENPTQIRVAKCRQIDNSEQPYERRVVIDSEWKPIDAGWIKDPPGLLVVRNCEGRYAFIPSDEERRRVDNRIIEIRYADSGGGFLIRPGEALSCTPSTVAGLEIRCQSETALAVINVYPR